MICAGLTILLLLYILFDINYFIHITFIIFHAKFIQKKRKPLETSSIYGLCITQDIDLFIDHMNNARYLRELDMARFHFFISNNIFQEVTKRKGFGLLAASSIRYRRPIPVFSSYRIDTKIVYWDDKNFYLEHQFITLSDGFIRAIVYGKQHVTGVNVIELMAIMTENNSISEVPPDVNHWLQSLEISSLTLRQKNE